VLCKVQQLQPFDGEAQVQLVGLPPKVTIEKNPLPITKASTDVTFNAALASDAPVGQHKSLFCQVVVMKDGEPIVHNVGGGGVLRIDEPPAAKPAAAAPPPTTTAAAPAPAAPAPAKPLSRLEKLRSKQRCKKIAAPPVPPSRSSIERSSGREPPPVLTPPSVSF